MEFSNNSHQLLVIFLLHNHNSMLDTTHFTKCLVPNTNNSSHPLQTQNFEGYKCGEPLKMGDQIFVIFKPVKQKGTLITYQAFFNATFITLDQIKQLIQFFLQLLNLTGFPTFQYFVVLFSTVLEKNCSIKGKITQPCLDLSTAASALGGLEKFTVHSCTSTYQPCPWCTQENPIVA